MGSAFKASSISRGLLVVLLKLGFALVAAKRNGLAVFAGSGDAWVARFAADWAFVSSHGG